MSPDYLRGIALFNGGDYFAAHEVWEIPWRAAADPDRQFYQSLIQAAVALYHQGRGIGTGRIVWRPAAGRKPVGAREHTSDSTWPRSGPRWTRPSPAARPPESSSHRDSDTTVGPIMSEDREALAGFGGAARLFPLPNLVLFPQVVQGLHIFEPRYRQMAADALNGDGLITLVLLKQGWEDTYDETPEIEAVGCLGRVTHHEQLPDGRYNLRVRGVCRVRLVEELRTDKLYRTARAELVPDVVPEDLPKLARLRRRLSQSVLTRFEPGGPAYQHLADLFHGELPLGPLCDMLAYALPIPLELKQHLLEQPHVDNRAEMLARALDATTVSPPTPPITAAEGRKFPPDFSAN